jgi:glycosyltransferase involved in cell wall biosynthesis
MKTGLSVLTITKNASLLLDDCLGSVNGLADEIILVDDFSTDSTVATAKKYYAKVFPHRQISFGDQRKYGLSKCSNDWILMLDADERLSKALKGEIRDVLQNPDNRISGYHIPFSNHFCGIPLKHGGEQYSKLVLFKKNEGRIVSDLIHERVEVEGKTATLSHPIIHLSYRSISQMFSKFTVYAKHEAKRKIENGEKSGIMKLLTYPAHMFYSRYVKDKGCKDHPLRILLDVGFAYMEFMTYFFMLFVNDNAQKSNQVHPVDQTQG